jgi:hypothetical protein
MSMVISEVTGWVLTMIIMYQPSIYSDTVHGSACCPAGVVQRDEG